MIRSFYKSKEWSGRSCGGGLVLILPLWLQVKMSLAINISYGRFFTLLQNAEDYVDKPQE